MLARRGPLFSLGAFALTLTGCSGAGGGGPIPAAAPATSAPFAATTAMPSAAATAGATPTPAPTASAATTAALTGRVVDDASGAPVAGATVVVGSGAYTPSDVYRRFQVFGSSQQTARSRAEGSAVGGSDGSFSLASVPNGLQQFQLSAPGYATYNTGVTLDASAKDLGTLKLHHLSNAESTWLALVNSDRAAYGNAPVAFDQVAYQTAAQHAADMAANDYFSHEDPAGRKPYVRYALQGGIGFDSENIAAGFASVTDAESAFMSEAASKGGHFLNIEDVAHDWVGLARATAPPGAASAYGSYYDQEFVNIAGIWDPTQIPTSVPAGSTLRVDVLAPASAGTVLGETLWETTPVATAPPTGTYSLPGIATTVAPTALSRKGEYEFVVSASKSGLNELLVFAQGVPTTPLTITNGAIAMPIVWTN